MNGQQLMEYLQSLTNEQRKLPVAIWLDESQEARPVTEDAAITKTSNVFYILLEHKS